MSEHETDNAKDIDRDGRIALYLRNLHDAQPKEQAFMIAELCDLTGQDFGSDLRKWAEWFLQNRLGLDITLRPQDINLTEESHAAHASANTQKPIFDKPEYNWCALERVKSEDDMKKLRHLYTDLESPLCVMCNGPFSFLRLTGLDSGTCKEFHGHSITETIFGKKSNLPQLRILKEYGKRMMSTAFPAPTQRTGAIVYSAAIAQSWIRHEACISSLAHKEFCDSLASLLKRPYLVDPYKSLFEKVLDHPW